MGPLCNTSAVRASVRSAQVGGGQYHEASVDQGRLVEVVVDEEGRGNYTDDSDRRWQCDDTKVNPGQLDNGCCPGEQPLPSISNEHENRTVAIFAFEER